MRKRLASSRKTSGPYICSIIAFGAFPLRKPGSVIWLPTLRTARRIASADSSSSAVISSCTRLSGSRSIVNFTRARPLSVASGGSSNRRVGLDRIYQNASGPPEAAASMLRKLAGGLPTGEYSRRYPGPNSERCGPFAPPPLDPAGSTPCVDRLSRDLSRSVHRPDLSGHETVRTVRIPEPAVCKLASSRERQNLCLCGIESSYCDFLSHDCRAFIPVVRCCTKQSVGRRCRSPAPAPPRCSPLSKLARPVMAERSVRSDTV